MLKAIRRIYGAPLNRITLVGSSQKSKYSNLDKIKALNMYNESKSYSEVERLTGIARGTVHAWVSKYKEGLL